MNFYEDHGVADPRLEALQRAWIRFDDEWTRIVGEPHANFRGLFADEGEALLEAAKGHPRFADLKRHIDHRIKDGLSDLVGDMLREWGATNVV